MLVEAPGIDRADVAATVADLPPRLAVVRAAAEVGGERKNRDANFGKCCSFSAVSAPIFTTKYAFCSIFENLPDYLAAIFEIWQNFANFATFAKCLLKFHQFS